MSKIIGIDLGTTNSAVAVMQGGEPTVIPNQEGARTTPSVVGITKSGERLVGQVAKRQSVTNPENTIYSIKRFIGKNLAESTEEMKRVPYKVIAGPHNDARVEMLGKNYSPAEISAMVLQKLKSAAEDFLGEKVTKAVITVPAYFNDSERQATKQAGEIAGLEVMRIINEPTAAALAYGLDKKKDETIAVYDLGGGTFDISILEVGEGVVEVKSTAGDVHLGGDDIDQRVMEWMVAEFKKDQGIDLSKDRMAIQRLKEAAEKAKCELSQLSETEINLPFVTADASGPKHLQLKLSRSKLEQLMEDILQRTVGPVKQALQDAGLTFDKIDEVVLVGGSTRIPRVNQIVKDLFGGKEPHKGVNPDEVVAVGASIQGGVLGGEVKDILLLDVTPLSLGVETLGGVMTTLISRNTTIPTRKSEIFSTAADNQTSVEIHVLQGERPLARDNRTLGKFHLVGIPPAPRGVPQIEVTFDIDANGILNVSAKDMATNKEQKITITASTGLSKDETERMRREAETHTEDDRKRLSEIEARNRCDSLVYQTEKLLKENRDKLSEPDAKSVEEAITVCRAAMTEGGAEKINAATDALMRVSHRVAEVLYRPGAAAGASAGQPGPAGSSAPGAPGAQSDVIDAEFVDVDENKKPNYGELCFPDYSSEERSYQLIHQLAGRVGRGHREGTVVIQTYNPDSISIKAVDHANSWQDFYDAQLQERKQFGFPPFFHTLKIEVARAKPTAAELSVRSIETFIHQNFGRVELIGPSPSFIAKRNNKYSWQLIVKAKNRQLLVDIALAVPIKCTFDIDPLHLL